MNVNLNYKLTPRLNLAVGIENATNENVTWLSYGSQTPAYARTRMIFNSGAHYAIGLSGTF